MNQKHYSRHKSWMIILGLVLIVAFQGWLCIRLIGDRGMPDWDYRPIQDVPGESAYTLTAPYQPRPTQQHVQAEPDMEKSPLQILNLQRIYSLEGRRP